MKLSFLLFLLITSSYSWSQPVLRKSSEETWISKSFSDHTGKYFEININSNIEVPCHHEQITYSLWESSINRRMVFIIRSFIKRPPSSFPTDCKKLDPGFKIQVPSEKVRSSITVTFMKDNIKKVEL